MYYDFARPCGSSKSLRRNYKKCLVNKEENAALPLRLTRLKYACEYAQTLARRCWFPSRRRRWLERAVFHAYEALELQEEWVRDGQSPFFSEGDVLLFLGALVEGNELHRKIVLKRLGMLRRLDNPVLEMRDNAIGYQLFLGEYVRGQLLLIMAKRAVFWWNKEIQLADRYCLARAILWIAREARRCRFALVENFFRANPITIKAEELLREDSGYGFFGRFVPAHAL